MTAANIDCYFAGLAVVDVLAIPDAPFAEDRKIQARRIIVDGGGPSGNAACAAAKAGATAGLLSVIGRDEWTKFSLASLDSFGVDRSLVRVRTDFKTPVSVIVINPETAGRTILWNSQGINDIELSLTAAETEKLLSARVVQFDGHLMRLAHELAPQAKARGTVVCYDCGSPKPGWETLAKHTDCFIASHAMAEQLGREIEPMIAELKASFGFKIAVTAGEKGYYYFNDAARGVEFVPQRKFNAADTTGCGDAFHGAFAAAAAKGFEF